MNSKHKVRVAVFYISLLLADEVRIEVVPEDLGEEEEDDESPESTSGDGASHLNATFTRDDINVNSSGAFSELKSVSVVDRTLGQRKFEEFEQRGKGSQGPDPRTRFEQEFSIIEAKAIKLQSDCESMKSKGAYRCLDVEKDGHSTVKEIMTDVMLLVRHVPTDFAPDEAAATYGDRFTAVLTYLKNAYESSPEKGRLEKAGSTTFSFEGHLGLLARYRDGSQSPDELLTTMLDPMLSSISVNGQTMANLVRVPGNTSSPGGPPANDGSLETAMLVANEINELELCYRASATDPTCGQASDDCFKFETTAGSSDSYTDKDSPPNMEDMLDAKLQLDTAAGMGQLLLTEDHTWGLCLPSDHVQAEQTLKEAQGIIKSKQSSTGGDSLVQLQGNKLGGLAEIFTATAQLWGHLMGIINAVLIIIYFVLQGITGFLKFLGSIGKFVRWMLMGAACLLLAAVFGVALIVLALILAFAVGSAWAFPDGGETDAFARSAWDQATSVRRGGAFMQLNSSSPITDILKDHFPACFLCVHLPDLPICTGPQPTMSW